MADFGIAYSKLRLLEGSRRAEWVNDPNDAGGETYAGIARRFHPDADIWILIDGAKKLPGFPGALDETALREQLELAVADFYFVEFWKPGRFDVIVDQALANELFEEAVNLGLGTAIRILQTVLNALNLYGKRWPDVTVDGQAGPSTTYAAARCHAIGMSPDVRKFCNVEQGHHYLASRNENFIRGWGARVEL